MRRPAARLLLISVLLLGCAGSQVRPARIRAALDRRDPAAALAELERYRAPEDLLWQMERGLLLRANGRLRESNEAFFAARRRQEELFTRSVSNEAAALAWNDRIRPYRAPAFEAPFLYVYPMLNFLELNDLEGAMVEARALSLELEARRDSEEGAAGDWPFGRLLSGLIFESAGEWNDAWIAYSAADNAWVGSAAPPDSGLKRWLAGARRRCAVAAGLEPGAPLEDHPGANPARVVVVAEEGFVPAREECRLLVPILREEAGWREDRIDLWGDRLAQRARERRRTGRTWTAEEAADWIALSFPAMPEMGPGRISTSMRLESGGAAWSLWRAVDLERAARDHLEASQPGLIARAAGRALLKWLAARGAERRSGDWRGRLVEWIGVASERADTRAWTTLPSQISLRVVDLEPGEIRLTVRRGEGETCTGSFAIAAGGWHFLGCRFY